MTDMSKFTGPEDRIISVTDKVNDNFAERLYRERSDYNGESDG